MIITASGRKVTLKQSFLDMVEKRLQKFDRYFEKDAEAAVTVTVENSRQTVEITVRYRGFIYRAEKTDFDMETAFADAADLIDRQITRHKKKLGNRIKRQDPALEPLEAPEAPEPQEFAEGVYRIAREKRFSVKPMEPDEAILQMNMLGHSFFLFRLVETGEVALVYRRHDDSYGLLIPEE